MIQASTSTRVGVLVLSVAAIGACGQSFTRSAAIESFQTANPDASEPEAACVVDGLIDRYGLEDLEAELGADPLDASFEEDQFREMVRCDVAGQWRDEIADQLVDNGVPERDAPCVADELLEVMDDDDIDVLLSGRITDQFQDKFLAALDACGALNPGAGSGSGDADDGETDDGETDDGGS